MLSTSDALNRLDAFLAEARKAGADAADAVYFGETSTEIGVRLGRLEDIGRSEGEEMGLRVFVGQQTAAVAISDLSPRAVKEAAERAVAMARETPEDRFAGLAPEELLATGPFPDFDLHDPRVAGMSAEELREMALEVEGIARGFPEITNSEGASASAGTSTAAFVTSHGFHGANCGTSVGASVVVVAGEGDGMERDYDWHQARHFSDLMSMEAIGKRAAERTIARLSPKRPEAGRIPVVFDPRIGSSLLGHLISAISGNAIARRTSFLLDHEGEQLFRPDIIVTDDPHLSRGLRSRAFDGEGLPTARSSIVEHGIVTGWLIDTAAGRQLGRAPTGHAARSATGPAGISASNLWLEAGEQSVAELMADIQTGLYVTELIGMGVNGLTGDYSRGAGGFMIRNGEIAEPVTEATIAGNLRDMYGTLTPANDLDMRDAVNVPTLRIDGMTVAGG